MARYQVNPDAIARARELIDARQYVLDSDWGDVQPTADAENAYLKTIPGTSTPPGTWASPKERPTTPRPGTPSSTAICAGSIAPG